MFFEITDQELMDKDKLNNILTDLFTEMVPKSIKKSFNKSGINELYETYGTDAFLNPDEKKFPVINPNTGKYDCDLILASMVRKRQLHEDVSSADALYEQCSCKKTIDVKWNEKIYNFLELIDNLEL